MVISIIYICKSGQKVIDDRRYTALFKIKLFLIIIIILNFLTGNDSNLLIVFYVQIMPDDFVMQLHRF
ncbi:PTS mannitol transporter subunit IIA [Escherichia coli]|nr:PTS mannitol transporter subunit IIA [Escherichia coli]